MSVVEVIVSGTLAGACCVIQLALSLFGIGCAGFAALTPFRPVFFLLNGLTLYKVFHHCSTLVFGILATLSVILGFSPEIVGMWNNRAESSALALRPHTIVIDGIACQACTTTVKLALQNISGVAQVACAFQSKDLPTTATVYMVPNAILTRNQISAALADANPDLTFFCGTVS